MIFYINCHDIPNEGDEERFEFVVDISDNDGFVYGEKIQEVVDKWEIYGTLDGESGFSDSGIAEVGYSTYDLSPKECLIALSDFKQCFIENGFDCGEMLTVGKEAYIF